MVMCRVITPITENQLEMTMDNDMETELIWSDQGFSKLGIPC